MTTDTRPTAPCLVCEKTDIVHEDGYKGFCGACVEIGWADAFRLGQTAVFRGIVAKESERLCLTVRGHLQRAELFDKLAAHKLATGRPAQGERRVATKERASAQDPQARLEDCLRWLEASR